MKLRRPIIPARRRAAIYTRVSTTAALSQEVTSLDVQREACRARIAQEPAWEPLPHSYDDGGYTGANTDRPAFQRLIADIRAGHVHVVVAYKLDRICRSFTDFAKLVELCEEHDVVLVSVTQNFNTGDIMGRLLRNLLAIFAEFERELIVERTRDKIAAARRMGKWTGGFAPLGYDVVAKKLIVNDDEAVVVREVFALYLEHRSVLRVAQELARRERTTKRRAPSERALERDRNRKPGEQRRSGPHTAEEWSKDMVLRVLKNPVYAGLIANGADLFPGEHKAVLDRETFDRVQRILAENAGRPAMRGRSDDYLLTGRLRCGACGAAMTPASTRKGNRTYRFYRCVTRDKMGKDACVARPLPAAEIERYVVEQLSKAGATERFGVEVTKGLDERLAAERDALGAESSRLAGPIARLEAESKQLLETVALLTGPAKQQAEAKLQDTCRELDEVRGRAREVERQRAVLRDTEIRVAWVTQILRDFDELWAVMTPENRRRLLAAAVQSVVVHEKDSTMRITFADLGAGPAEAA